MREVRYVWLMMYEKPALKMKNEKLIDKLYS